MFNLQRNYLYQHSTASTNNFDLGAYKIENRRLQEIQRGEKSHVYLLLDSWTWDAEYIQNDGGVNLNPGSESLHQKCYKLWILNSGCLEN